MVKVYKKSANSLKKLVRLLGIVLLFSGVLLTLYTFLPILSWQIYFAPVFASQSLSTPIPHLSAVPPTQIGSLFNSAALNLSRDYTNAANWYPTSNLGRNKNKAIQSYKLSIPKLNIIDATVSTTDNDLSSHLVNFQGTSVPPEKGNSVIFGHSTLPQLFDPKNYKTIFANAYKLQVGDEVFVNLPNISYKYRIMNITIVEPDDTSVLEQNYNDSYLTLITCTPPGTIWKRLVIKAKLEEI